MQEIFKGITESFKEHSSVYPIKPFFHMNRTDGMLKTKNSMTILLSVFMKSKVLCSCIIFSLFLLVK